MGVHGTSGGMSCPLRRRSGAEVRTRNTEYRTRLRATAPASIYTDWICRRSDSCSVVVVQQSAETLTPFHFPALADEFWIWTDELVLETLVIAFAVVMHDKLRRCAAN